MESVKLIVNVDSTQLNLLENRINILKSTPITLTINATGLENANADTVKLINSCARLVEAQASLSRSENSLSSEHEKTARAVERTAQEELKLERQRLSTEATANRTQAAEARYATQQEKTATAAKNLEIQQEKTNTAIARGGENAVSAATRFDTLLTSYLKFQAISAIRSGISSAFDAMKDVDSQLINIQKVTDESDNAIKALGDRAYTTASYYGVSAENLLEAEAAFAKAGYKNYEELAELATKTQLVGDVNAETASQFLLAADAAYKMQGNVEKLSTALDNANTIENNYATSIQKIAEGLPHVASTAAMAHMTLEELMAMLGTITAVTQESGSKAAYASRALIMNIVGEVGKIDETTEVTEESINSLWSVVEKYADASIVAAHAAGELINPMEVIGALSKAQNENLLTEVDLTTLAMSLGGKLRTNQLKALIDNYDMYEEMLAKVKESAGSADNEVETMRKSWGSKLAQLKNAWTKFVSAVVDTGAIKDALTALTKIVKLLSTGFGSFTAKAALLTTIFYKLITSIGKMAGKLKESFLAWRIHNAEVQKSIGLGQSATLSFGTLMASLGVAAVLSVVSALRSAREKAQEEYRKMLEDARTASEELRSSIDTRNETTSDILELFDAYEQAKTGTGDLTTASEKLAAALREVGIGAAGAQGDLSEYRAELLKNTAATNLSEAQTAQSKAEFALTSAAESIGGVASPNMLNPTTGEAEMQYTISGGNVATRVWDGTGKGSLPDLITLEPTGYSAEEILDFYNVLLNFQEQINEKGQVDPSVYGTPFAKAVEKRIEAYKSYVEEYSAATTAVATASAYSDALDSNIKTQENFDERISAIKSDTGFSEEVRNSWLQGLRDMYPEYAKVNQAQAEYEAGIEASGKKTERFVDTLFDGNGKLKDYAASMLGANSALDDLAKTQAKEDLEAAQKSLETFFNTIGGKDSEAATKALQLFSMSAEEMKAAFASDETGELEETYKGLKAAMDAVNAAQERYDALQSASKSKTEDTQMSVRQLAAVLLDEKGAINLTALAAIQADSALSSFYKTQIQAAASAAQADYDALIAQLKDVSDAAVQAALGLAAMATAYAGSDRGYGFGAVDSENIKQISVIRSYQESLRLLEIAKSLGSSGSIGGGGGGGSGKDAALTAISDRLAVAKQELALMKERGDDADKLIEKERQIQAILHEQAEYLRASNGDQKDILSLSTEWWKYENDIQKQLNSAKEDQLELEEKILAVQEAQAALANAQAERTVRYYNEATNQWEWVANPKDVQSAEKSLSSAQEALKKYDGDLGEYGDVVDNLLTDNSGGMSGVSSGANGLSQMAGAQNTTTNTTTTSTIGHQMNGNVYQIAGLTFNEQQAKSLTLHDLAQLSGNLRIYASDY